MEDIFGGHTLTKADPDEEGQVSRAAAAAQKSNSSTIHIEDYDNKELEKIG